MSYFNEDTRAAGTALMEGSIAALDFDLVEEDSALWCWMKPAEKPMFTRPLLDGLARTQRIIHKKFQEGARVGTRPFDYLVLGATQPEDTVPVFSWGGDLTLFQDAIRARNRDTLWNYANECVSIGHVNYSGYDNRVITIALVEGEALGGGFEAALTCDVRIAERRASFGFPEPRFNLFPGMGAYSYLPRLIGPQRANEVISRAMKHTAQDMAIAGAVDFVAEDGRGASSVVDYIRERRGLHNSEFAMHEARRIENPVTLWNLRAIANLWVDTAMRLTERELRQMERIGNYRYEDAKAPTRRPQVPRFLTG